MKIRHHWLSFVAAALLSAALIAGCEEKPAAPSGNAGTETAASPEPTTEAARPAESPSGENVMGPPTPPPAALATPAPDPVNMPKVPFKGNGQPVTTKSGLIYEDMTVGTGAAPKTGQNVKMQYVGWDATGTIFDSSYKRGEPFEFTLGVGQVIKGWDEGVGSMKVGGRRKLIIPPDLAYGGRPGMPFDTAKPLTFDVVLEGIAE
ncbi:MAG: FKBP-type peptidyl-prolyl cis-trans isomerase [Capsulimonadales bacterium]|nr:FKBP-type peptidyl-prolyl cis-trans isomerase [Capsulimonadales bacterium]